MRKLLLAAACLGLVAGLAAPASADLAPAGFYCAYYRPHGGADALDQAYWNWLTEDAVTARCLAHHGTSYHYYHVTVNADGSSYWTPLSPTTW